MEREEMKMRNEKTAKLRTVDKKTKGKEENDEIKFVTLY